MDVEERHAYAAQRSMLFVVCPLNRCIAASRRYPQHIPVSCELAYVSKTFDISFLASSSLVTPRKTSPLRAYCLSSSPPDIKI